MGCRQMMLPMVSPEYPQKRLRTTNFARRINEEISRRKLVTRISSNNDPTVRLLGAVLIGNDEEWCADRRHLNMGETGTWLLTVLCRCKEVCWPISSRDLRRIDEENEAHGRFMLERFRGIVLSAL